MNILITGGAGYIGTGLIAALSSKNVTDKIIVYDNLSRGNYSLFLGNTWNTKIEFIQGDILDNRSLKKAMEGTDVVYHLAAKVTTPFANLDPHIYEQINHWGTSEVVTAVEETQVKQLIYLSSTSVYGASDQLVNEQTRTNPATFYGTSKLRGEQHVSRLVDKGKAVIIRAGNVYGLSPSMRFDAVINRFAFEANFLKRISIKGSGKQSRAFIHLDKISEVLADLPFNEVPSGVYNLAQSNYSVLDLVDTFKELIPELEFIFVDQYLELRNFKLDTQLELRKYLELPKTSDLKTELEVFLEKFSF